MTFVYAVRYFKVVGVVSALFVAGFVIAVAAAAVRLTSDPSAGVEALTPVLLLQLFVSSSGFQFAARRGYYDLLLTSGTPLWEIAIAHCLVSIAPGVVSWLCVGLIELAASHGMHASAFASGTCIAVLGSSLAAWGTAVFSSRPTAAVAWLLAMTIPPVTRLVSPLRLLGAAATGPQRFEQVVLGLAAVALFAIGVFFITRTPTPLEATQ